MVHAREDGEPRVLHCLDSLELGGTELNALKVMQATAGHARHFLAHYRGGNLQDRFAARCESLISLPTGGIPGLRHLRVLRVLRQAVARHRITVVHCHDMYSNALGWLLGGRPGRPLTITSLRWEPAQQPWHLRHAGTLAYRRSDRVVTNAESHRATLRAAGVPPGIITCVPNILEAHLFADPGTVAADRASLRRAHRLSDDALVVGMVANFNHHKDQGTLIRAAGAMAGRFPSLRVVMVGDGPTIGEARQLVAALGLGHLVTFVGQVADGWRWHRAFDISVLCSHGEGSPNSLLEAMAASRAVVATRVGGIPDSVAEGTTGRLVPPEDPEALQVALAGLLEDPVMREAYGAAGLAMVRERHGAEAVGRLWLSLYRGEG